MGKQGTKPSEEAEPQFCGFIGCQRRRLWCVGGGSTGLERGLFGSPKFTEFRRVL